MASIDQRPNGANAQLVRLESKANWLRILRWLAVPLFFSRLVCPSISAAEEVVLTGLARFGTNSMAFLRFPANNYLLTLRGGMDQLGLRLLETHVERGEAVIECQGTRQVLRLPAGTVAATAEPPSNKIADRPSTFQERRMAFQDFNPANRERNQAWLAEELTRRLGSAKPGSDEQTWLKLVQTGLGQTQESQTQESQAQESRTQVATEEQSRLEQSYALSQLRNRTVANDFRNLLDYRLRLLSMLSPPTGS